MRKVASTQQQRQTSSLLNSIFNSRRKEKAPAETKQDRNSNLNTNSGTPFALRQPSTSSLLKKRQKRQTRGASWPLASIGATPMAAAAAPTPIQDSNEGEHVRLVMGGGSVPTSPLWSSPGIALSSLSLGNPKTSSLHKRRQLRRSQKRFVEQPLGPGGLCARSLGHEQPWSPRTCLNLNATPPDSPMWGFGAAHSPTAAAVPAASAAPAPASAAAAAAAATGIASSIAAFSSFDSMPTPSTQGNQTTAESSSWAGTHFGFGDPAEDHMEQWVVNSMSPRKSVASYC